MDTLDWSKLALEVTTRTAEKNGYHDWVEAGKRTALPGTLFFARRVFGAGATGMYSKSAKALALIGSIFFAEAIHAWIVNPSENTPLSMFFCLLGSIILLVSFGCTLFGGHAIWKAERTRWDNCLAVWQSPPTAELVRTYLSDELERLRVEILGVNGPFWNAREKIRSAIGRARVVENRLGCRLDIDTMRVAHAKVADVVRTYEIALNRMDAYEAKVNALLEEMDASAKEVEFRANDMDLLREANAIVAMSPEIIRASETAMLEGVRTLKFRIGLARNEIIKQISTGSILDEPELRGEPSSEQDPLRALARLDAQVESIARNIPDAP